MRGVFSSNSEPAQVVDEKSWLSPLSWVCGFVSQYLWESKLQ